MDQQHNHSCIPCTPFHGNDIPWWLWPLSAGECILAQRIVEEWFEKYNNQNDLLLIFLLLFFLSALQWCVDDRNRSGLFWQQKGNKHNVVQVVVELCLINVDRKKEEQLYSLRHLILHIILITFSLTVTIIFNGTFSSRSTCICWRVGIMYSTLLRTMTH